MRDMNMKPWFVPCCSLAGPISAKNSRVINRMGTISVCILRFSLVSAVVQTLLGCGQLASGYGALHANPTSANAIPAHQSKEQSSSVQANAFVPSSLIFTKEFTAMLHSPDTPKAVLQNIKYALEHDLFLQKDFYTTSNFNSFLGMYTTKQTEDLPTSMEFFFETTASPHYSSCIELGTMSWREFQQSTTGKIGHSGGFDGRVKNTNEQNDPHLTPLCAQFSADTMLEVFGKPTDIRDIFSNQTPPPHGMKVVFGAKTHSLGHSYVTYSLGDKNTKRIVTFTIIGNGMISTFNASNIEGY